MENAEESGAGQKPTETESNPSPNLNRGHDAAPTAEQAPLPRTPLPSEKPTEEDPNPNPDPEGAAAPTTEPAAEQAPLPRTPFTNLSQVDADLALARVLQEQERAYMMLRMNGGGEGSYSGTSEAASYEYDEEYDLDHGHPIEEDGGSVEGSDYGEDAFDANDPDFDPGEFEDDEAFARALQDFEDREVTVRMMALVGLANRREEEHEDNGYNSQDAWQEVDLDEYSYEELIALGEVVGTESRGLSADTIASLSSIKYKAQDVQDGNNDQCVICRLEYDEGESLIVLPCKHTYHSECINKWLQINKVCPMCSAEVSTSGQ